MTDYLLSENELTRTLFNLEDVLSFQLDNDVQIIRGEDYMYLCYVNGSVYATGLTPMYALVRGIICYKEQVL